MAFRPLSVVSDFREALWGAMSDAQDAGLDLDQIIEITRGELRKFENDWIAEARERRDG